MYLYSISSYIHTHIHTNHSLTEEEEEDGDLVVKEAGKAHIPATISSILPAPTSPLQKTVHWPETTCPSARSKYLNNNTLKYKRERE